MGGWGPAEWEAAGTLATAGLALLALIFAGLQVREANKTRKAQAQPFVVVSLEPSRTSSFIIELVIENIGSTLARDVKFSFDPPLKSALYDDALEGSFLLREGIPTMPPGMRLARIFDSAIERREAGDLPWRFEVTVQFSDYRGKRDDPLQYVLDLEPFRSGTFTEQKSIHHAAKALDEIQKSLKGWTRGSRLQIAVRDADYHDWADTWQEEHGDGSHPSLGNPYPAGRPSPSKYDHLDPGGSS